MSMKRRSFVKTALAGGAVVMGASLLPRLALAEWPKAAFEAKEVDAALKALGAEGMTESTEIVVKAPDIAENGAVVPIQINTTLANVESIALIAEKNPIPLIANFKFAENGAGYVSTRIKMGATSHVVAVVKAGGKYYSAKKEVKVTIGGCGG